MKHKLYTLYYWSKERDNWDMQVVSMDRVMLRWLVVADGRGFLFSQF